MSDNDTPRESLKVALNNIDGLYRLASCGGPYLAAQNCGPIRLVPITGRDASNVVELAAKRAQRGMLRRLVLIAAIVLAATIAVDPSAGAQTAGTWTSQDGRITILGAVNMCVDPAGKATPCQGAPVTAASGNVANASAAATLAGAVGLTTYICGMQITASGATAASVVSATLAGLISGTATYTVAVPAGVTAGVQPLVISFAPCVPASATNTSIVLTLPALGAGNTNAAVAAQGFRY